MSTFNTKIAASKTRLRKFAHAIHRNQKGTALTEFVICIPVFIIIFGGVINLNKMQRKSMAIKIQATEQVWSKAIPVQDSLFSQRMLSRPNGTERSKDPDNHPGHQKADKIEKDAGKRLKSDGHFGESYALVHPAEAHADIGVDAEKEGKNVYNNRDYSRDLLRDDNQFRVAGGSMIMMLVNSILNFTGSRPALGAGIRYGIAVGNADGNVTIGTRSFHLETSYNVLVAPRPTEEAWSVGVARATAESYDPFSKILGIEEDDRL